jgi:hypothetical protein
MLGEMTTRGWLFRAAGGLKPLAYFAVYIVAAKQSAKDNKLKRKM